MGNPYNTQMKKILCSFLAVGFSGVLYSQDKLFLNTNTSLLELNPSYAGLNGGFRNQNTFLSNNGSNLAGDRTFVSTADGFIKAIHAGIGGGVFYNNSGAGFKEWKSASLVYAQHIQLGKKSKLVPSLRATYFQKTTDLSKITFSRLVQWQGEYPLHGTISNFDFSAGLLLNINNRFISGFSCFHMNRPNIGLTQAESLGARFDLHATYYFLQEENMQVQIFGRYGMQRHGYEYGQLSVNGIIMNRIIAGTGLRSVLGSGNALNLTVGYRNDFISVQGTYGDVFTKDLRKVETLYELQLGFRINKNNKTLSFET